MRSAPSDEALRVEDIEFEAGVDYEPVEDIPDKAHEYIVFPHIVGVNHDLMCRFRALWILRKARRPYVVAPAGTPLPNASMSSDQRARISSVYWRPWVLHKPWATLEVPHLCDLNRILVPQPVSMEMSGKKLRLREKFWTCYKEDTDLALVYGNDNIVGYRAAWKHYTRGNVVSESAAQLIRNFFAGLQCQYHA